MPNLRYYKIALKLCEDSDHTKHKMAAVLVKGGAVVSKATNRQLWGAHAEKRALHARRTRRAWANGGTLYVARLGGRMSRPCEACLNVLRKLGIDKVVFANWDGHLIVEKI